MNSVLPSEGFVRMPQLVAVFSVSESTIWRWVRAGKLPKPVKLGERTSAWPVEAVRSAIDQFSETAEG